MIKIKLLSIICFILSPWICLHASGRMVSFNYEGQTLYYEILDEELRTCKVVNPSLIPTPGGILFYPKGVVRVPSQINVDQQEFSVVEIAERAFEYAYDLTEVILPNSVKKIGEGAFRGASGLKTVNLPDSLERIERDTFHGCEVLNSISLPEGLSYIGASAFEKCNKGLTEITFPESLRMISNRAFEYCSKLQTVTFTNNQPISLGYVGFDYINTPIKNVRISNLKAWSQSSFSLNSNPIGVAKTFSEGGDPIHHLDLNLRSEDSPEMGMVSEYAFKGADNLETVRISADKICADSFRDCRNLKKLCLDVDEIDYDAFDYLGHCNIDIIYFLTQFPPAGCFMYYNIDGRYFPCKVYVPIGCIANYQGGEWAASDFYYEIFESDFADIDEIFKPDHSSGIEEVYGPVDNSSKISGIPDGIYTLDGRRISPEFEILPPGMYIECKDGKTTKKVMSR